MMTEDRSGSYPSQMKNTHLSCMLITHVVRLSTFLSSAALKQQPSYMKTVQVIKMWRGRSPSHPQPADSVQTDIEPAYAEGRCHTWMESEWRQDEKKVVARTRDSRT